MLFDLEVPLVPFLAAAATALAVGYAWFSPLLFGRALRGAAGARTPRAAHGAAVVAALSAAYAASLLVENLVAFSVADGLAVGLVLWLPVASATVVAAWVGGRPLAAALAWAGQQLASLLAMGALLAGWPV